MFLSFYRVEPWQIRLLFDLGLQGWLGHVAVVALAGGVLVTALPGASWPLLWLGAMLLLSFGLAVLSRRYSSARVSSEPDMIRAGYAHTGLTVTVGLLWAVGAFGAAAGGPELLAIYSLALGGTALGAVCCQHAVPRSAMASIWSSVPLLGVAHLGVPAAGSGLPVALMLLLYAVILSLLSVHMFRLLSANHELTCSLKDRVDAFARTTAALGEARHEAEEANLAKSRFLAQASHDLRQPIHAIGLLAASLKDTRLSREQRKIVGSIEQSVDSVTKLFASLLDISRLDVGGVEPRRGPLDLGAFLDRITIQNRALAARSGCTLIQTGTHVWVEADENLLFTMVQNILGNAIKYAPGSRILIGPRRIGGRLAIQVCDTGPGIERSQLDAVFEEYYRPGGGGSGQGGEGMGLGLTIVRRLGDLLGLDVRLSSIRGRGTSVVIAGLEACAPVMRAPASPARTHPLSGTRICLVDDDDVVRAATVRLLERWGCVVMAGSGLGDADYDDCDAILTDMHLGECRDGLELVSTVRRRANRAIPALILTGRGDRATLERIEAAGLPLLAKPVRPPELRSVLTRLCLGLGHRQSANEG